MRLNIAYTFRPARPTTRTTLVMDHFGIDRQTGPHIVARDLELPIAPGDVVLFTGPSGAGKSSLLRAAAHAQASPRRQSGPESNRNSPVTCSTSTTRTGPRLTSGARLASGARPQVIDIDALPLPDAALVDAIPLPISQTLQLLAQCGLGEARLLLRTPAELSDGQRYRFRLALGLARAQNAATSQQQTIPPTHPSADREVDPPRGWLLADEFTATLDRTLAKVVAFNVRRLADRTGVGFLLATTHEDIAADLAPDLHVHCRLDGQITLEHPNPTSASPRRKSGPPETHTPPPQPTARRISFFHELTITPGTKKDWHQFAGWHYRSRHLGFVRQVKLLRHHNEPVGICVFVSPPPSLGPRNRYFGRSGRWDRPILQTLNRQLLMLSRVVLHPTCRGAGIAAWFVHECCRASGYRWIETLAQMGHIHPLFERAGFVRVGACSPPRGRSRADHSALYGNPVTSETFRKSRHTAPVYYIFDNHSEPQT